MATVFANGRSIVHKGDGQTNTSAPPDACKTPTPGGPVPVPYVNIAMTSDLADGTKTIKIQGHPAGKADSNIATSSGDEPGTAGGGLMSSKTKGKLTWGTKSSDVKFEGQGVVRFMEVTQHNGNTFNTVFQEMGGTGLAYGDDSSEGECPICGKNPDTHRILETKSIASVCTRIIRELQRLDYPDGFMVGVAACKCNQIIVATSGNTPEKFGDIASSSGATKIVLDSAIKTPEQAISRIPKLAAETAQKTFADTWKVLKKKSCQGGGYTKPGNCAAQKIAAQGHVLVAMSEMMYSPSAMTRWRKSYRLRTTVHGDSSTTLFFNEAAGILDEPKGVASCYTCQELLPMMLCDKDRSC